MLGSNVTQSTPCSCYSSMVIATVCFTNVSPNTCFTAALKRESQFILLTREMASGEAVGCGGKLRHSRFHGMNVTRAARRCIISVPNRDAVASVSTTTCLSVLPVMTSAVDENLASTSIRRRHQTGTFIPAIDTDLSLEDHDLYMEPRFLYELRCWTTLFHSADRLEKSTSTHVVSLIWISALAFRFINEGLRHAGLELFKDSFLR